MPLDAAAGGLLPLLRDPSALPFAAGCVAGLAAGALLWRGSGASGSDDAAAAGAQPQQRRRRAPPPPPKEELKMVLCVNSSLGMGKGKIGAQCAHAAVGVLDSVRGDAAAEAAVAQWEWCGQPKVTLKIKDDAEMVRWTCRCKYDPHRSGTFVCVAVASAARHNGVIHWPCTTPTQPHTQPHTNTQPSHTQAELAARAVAAGLPAYIVRDAGRTQIAAGSQTVLAVGPAPKSAVDRVTGHLSLL